MSVNTRYYKKSGILLMNIARDFFAMRPGDRIGTILEYTEKFSVSRGIVQNAIATLEKEKCIRFFLRNKILIPVICHAEVRNKSIRSDTENIVCVQRSGSICIWLTPKN